MSLVYITYHDENIFDVEKKPPPEVRAGAKYVSKFKPNVREHSKRMDVIEQADGEKLLTESDRCRHKTMGYAETPLQPPCAFMRKHHGVRWRRFNDHVCPPGQMPPVPRFVRTAKSAPAGEPTPAETPTTKHAAAGGGGPQCPAIRLKGHQRKHKHRADFVALNIERAKTAETRRPVPRLVDTQHGDAHGAINSGLLPQYVCHRNFGKVPCYLRSHKRLLQRQQDRCGPPLLGGSLCPPELPGDAGPYGGVGRDAGLNALTAEERQEILNGLRQNYKELNHAYQRLPLFTDTVAKILRKSKVEKDLRQLEQDIHLVEANPIIYVSDL